MAAENPFAQIFQKSTVRLAALEPESGDDVLKLKIINADPYDTRYECISYDRSKDFDTTEVEVDGKSVKISKPLFSALKAFRRNDGPRTLWADLIVGNSVEERSKQAQEMKTVFEHADKTTAWLGSANPQRQAALDMIQNLANKWSQARAEFNIPEAHTRATFQQLGNAQAFFAAKGDQFQVSNKALWETVQKMFCNTYFATIQSISEIILSKSVNMSVGEKSVQWEDFAAASTAFAMLFPTLGLTPDPSLSECLQRIMCLQTATRRKRDGESLELFPMMKDARQTSFRDPREIVFSMLSIATPCTRTEQDERRPNLPAADYSASVAEVFKKASKYILEDRQDLMMFWYERPPCGRKVAGLPSWAVDWSHPFPDTVGGLISPHNGLRAWADPLNNKRIYVDDEDGLHVQAHALDRIDTVCEIFTPENCRRLCLQEWQKLRPQPNESNQARTERFAKTLILNIGGFGDSFRTSSAPSAQILRSFESLLAEERILQVLGCTMEELVTKPPEFIAEARAKPEIQALAGVPGHSQHFEQLLRNNTLGRRFFRCEGGRYGMTSIETPPPRAEGAPPIPSFDTALSDPLARAMMSSFQSFLSQRDPAAANAVSQGLRGELPGQQLPGVRTGDMVVAVIGGYQPYILRPALKQRTFEGPSAAPGAPSGSKDFFEYGNVNSAKEDDDSQLNDSTKYHFVGDCYLHGVMDGECFKETGWFGRQNFRKDVKTVDVTIV